MKLFENRIDYFLDIVNNPSLSADPNNLIDSEHGTDYLILVRWLKHGHELIEQIIIRVFLILGKVLLKLLGSLDLSVFQAQVTKNLWELNIPAKVTFLCTVWIFIEGP